MTSLGLVMRQRRAAALGMTIDEYDAHVSDEQRKNDELFDLYYNRSRQRAAIARHSAQHGRAFEVHR